MDYYYIEEIKIKSSKFFFLLKIGKEEECDKEVREKVIWLRQSLARPLQLKYSSAHTMLRWLDIVLWTWLVPSRYMRISSSFSIRKTQIDDELSRIQPKRKSETFGFYFSNIREIDIITSCGFQFPACDQIGFRFFFFFSTACTAETFKCCTIVQGLMQCTFSELLNYIILNQMSAFNSVPHITRCFFLKAIFTVNAQKQNKREMVKRKKRRSSPLPPAGCI